MDDRERLQQMIEQRHTLEDSIEDIDREIEWAEHAAVGADDPGRLVSFINERYRAQQGLFFDVGKLSARIEDLEQRIHEREEKQLEVAATDRWQDKNGGREDHLDWLRSTLDAPNPADKRDDVVQNPHREGEEPMLEDMQREGREPEDYLDWWEKR